MSVCACAIATQKWSSHRGYLERTDEIVDAENGAVLDVRPVAGELIDKPSYYKRHKLY